jgi:hypothetical protein
LVTEEPVEVGAAVSDVVEFVGVAPEIVMLLPIVEYVVQDDVEGAG